VTNNKNIRGIGVDIVNISRFEKKSLTPYILSRLFHPDEKVEVKEKEGEFYASRWAAKEALVKSLGSGFRNIAPQDIKVVVDELGKPSIVLSEKAIKTFNLQNSSIQLSLTHEKEIALAFVVVEDKCDS
jgi:holo-[acyl-carrier protein] synthase